MKRILLIITFCIGGLHAQQTQFFRTYSMGLFDVGETVIPINDTNYIVAGTTNTTGMNGTDLLLFKTNSIGDVTWWKSIGGTGIQSGKSAVMATDSTGYLIAGYKNNFDSTGYDVWLVKTDLNGDTTWTRSYGGNDWEIAHAINKLKDSTYIIAGETFGFGQGQRDMYIIRVDASGDTIWTRTFGGTANDVAKYIHIDRHDNMLIVGNTESFGAGNSDVYLVYMDLNGDTLWTKTIGTTGDDFGYSADMYIDTNNAMSFAIGYTSYFAPDQAQNTYILLVDSAAGNSLVLYPQYETDPYILDHVHLLQYKPGYITYTADYKELYDQPSILFAQKSSYGLTSIGAVTYASGGNENTLQNNIQLALDKGYIITGYSENWGPGPTSCFLLKTDTALQAPLVPIVSIENLNETSWVELFPNPVVDPYFYLNSSNYIESVRVFNLNGQVIHTYLINPNVKTLTLEKPIVSSGIYMVEVRTSAGVVYKKIIF